MNQEVSSYNNMLNKCIRLIVAPKNDYLILLKIMVATIFYENIKMSKKLK
jgi:hypothetical protein